MEDSLGLTPAGVCLRCADRNPLRTEPHSNPFWILSPGEVRRVEREINRLAAELQRMSESLGMLQQQHITSGGSRYDRPLR